MSDGDNDDVGGGGGGGGVHAGGGPRRESSAYGVIFAPRRADDDGADADGADDDGDGYVGLPSPEPSPRGSAKVRSARAIG